MAAGERRNDEVRTDGDASLGRAIATAVLLALPVLALSRAEEAVGTVLRFAGVDPASAFATGPEDADVLTTGTGTRLRVETVVSGLDTPWDLAWAPDGALWFTERPGRVSKLDPATGSLTRVGEIDVHESGEAGLMGMAFHPDFPAQPYLYFVHSYRAGGSILNRLIRVTYRDGQMAEREILVDGIPGRGNHNGSRLAIGPDRMLYMTMGDAGNAESAQDRNTPGGTIMRLTLDGKPGPANPFGNATWSYGHRNPQGLAFMPSNGRLYSTEHGPNEADEVNLIEPGMNYGWPAVRGDCNTDSERTFCSTNNVVEPIAEYTPTIGISGLAVYDSDRIPGWRNSLIYTSLTGQKLIRLVLSADGRSARNQELVLNGDYGRLRDVVVAADGTLYIATSNKDGRGRPARDDDRIIRITP